MKTLKWMVPILVLALSGCATNPFNPSVGTRLSNIEFGMSKDRVIQILGRPTDAGTGKRYEGSDARVVGFSEVLRYVRTTDRQRSEWIVVLVDDKVTEYGPFVGALRKRYGEVFPEPRK